MVQYRWLIIIEPNGAAKRNEKKNKKKIGNKRRSSPGHKTVEEALRGRNAAEVRFRSVSLFTAGIKTRFSSSSALISPKLLTFIASCKSPRMRGRQRRRRPSPHTPTPTPIFLCSRGRSIVFCLTTPVHPRPSLHMYRMSQNFI